MADNIASPPLKQPKTITQLVLQPWFSTNHLILYLSCLPNALDSEAALQELCTCDFASIFTYMLSLGYTQWHRRFMMETLAPRLKQLPVDVLKQDIAPLLPKLTALWYDPQAKHWFPIMGPLTETAATQWELHDWFFQLLHAKEMEGQFCQLYSHFVYCVSILTFTHLELRFS